MPATTDSGWLATTLDAEMLRQRGVAIASPLTDPRMLPAKLGATVHREIGGRVLVMYLSASRVGTFNVPLYTNECWVTPTAYSTEEAGAYLALPGLTTPRAYALLLDPRRIDDVRGPKWVTLGGGIEYYLPTGFPRTAIVSPDVTGRGVWEVMVR